MNTLKTKIEHMKVLKTSQINAEKVKHEVERHNDQKEIYKLKHEKTELELKINYYKEKYDSSVLELKNIRNDNSSLKKHIEQFDKLKLIGVQNMMSVNTLSQKADLR